MLLEPDKMVLYVHDLMRSSHFYQDLLGITPEEVSITFHSFKLSNGMGLALKAMHAVEPLVDNKNGNGELAFTLDRNQSIDELLKVWQAKKIKIIFPLCTVSYGDTFVALDPDENRLRVVALNQKKP